MSENIIFLAKKIFEIPPFFQTRPGDLGKKVYACSLRFSALKCFNLVPRAFKERSPIILGKSPGDPVDEDRRGIFR